MEIEINNWYLLGEVGYNKHKAKLYNCKCRNCGNKSIKTKGQMKRNVTDRCEKCPPEYSFKVQGDVAIGYLPDGTAFIIDAEDVKLVSKYHWRIHKGYVICSTRKNKMRLHRFLLNVPNDLYVDHINRNPFDCRKSNLRIVNNQQNSMNRGLLSTSTSGYTGVSWVNSKKRYRAQIGLNNRDIYLGSSKDPIICAQMYNIASDYLFGDYKGHQNDVPSPSEELKEIILEKLKPLKKEAELATQSCSPFLCSKGA